MNKKVLGVLVLIVVALCVGGLLLLFLPKAGPNSSKDTVGEVTSSPKPTTSEKADTSNESVTKPATEQPKLDLPKLTAGSTAPQFVVMSFDGGAEMKTGIMQHYLDLAKATDSRFSFYLSGVYLLPDDVKNKYKAPHKATGTSDIGFADPTMVGLRIDKLTEAWNMGMEIGTHYNGHFCGTTGSNTWNSSDWTSEINQWNDIVDNWRKYNPQASEGRDPLPFSSTVVRGGRTPCLEGNRPAMFSAFKSAGYTYDASGTGTLKWPTKMSDGLWEIPLQTINLPGNKPTLSMDYNFMAMQNNMKTTASPDKCSQIETQTYGAYVNALNAVKNGNRAPLILGNHMNNWVCGAYTDALTKFVKDTHKDMPDVKFISMVDLVNWMEDQDPALLKVWLNKSTQAQ